ncbi:MAG: hypothetical protein NT040_18160 [Bacteroidetes bacterium]|nr:hypothetical protein [Bacteroidota bacterium]
MRTSYHFRVVAVNSLGTSYGDDFSLAMLAPSLSVTPANQAVTAAAGSTSLGRCHRWPFTCRLPHTHERHWFQQYCRAR